MGIPDHLTCLLRILVRTKQLELNMKQQTGSKSGKQYFSDIQIYKGCILSPCLFNFYAEYIMRNAGLEEVQAGIKITRRNINNLIMQMTPPLWQKVKRNYKEPFDESEKGE